MGEISDTKGITATDGASNAPTPVPASAADEPRIIEEHIVTPPKAAPAPTAAPTPSTLSAPAKPDEPVNLSNPPVSSTQPEAPVLRPAAPQPSTEATDAKVNADISSILQGVKLPDRRLPDTAPQTSQRSYDTSLSGSEPKDQAERDARVLEAARAVNESLPNTAPKTSDDVRPVHTLKEDLQNVVRTRKISMVRAVALEEEKRHRPNVAPDEQAAQARRSNPILPVVLTLVLFLLGAGALGGTYLIMQERTAAVATPSNQLLFAEQVVPFPLSDLASGDIRREIATARNAGTLALGSILQIIPTATVETEDGKVQAPLTLGQFLTAIGASAPEELSRSLGNNLFFGFHVVDESAPVIVSTVASYERAFAAMLAWEGTMNGDLAPMFTPVSRQTIGADGLLTERKFTDSVIRNYDVRALKDEGGQIQLYYSFPTRNILIIAESPYSFTELLARLRADRRL